MIIEIKGVQFVNKGAELMLYAVIQQVNKRWPTAKIVLAPNKNSPYLSRAKLGTYQKLSLRKKGINLESFTYLIPSKLRAGVIRHFGIVTEADVDVVLDASGFAYGDQWDSGSIRSLCQELERMTRHNKKYIFLPQALGPFSRTQDIKVLKKTLPKASLVCAREETSMKNTQEVIGGSDNLFQYPDFTNLVDGIIPEYYRNGSQKVLIIPNSNMMSSRNNKTDWMANYVRVLSDCVSIVKEQGLTPVLLNHEGAGDRDICQKVIDLCGSEIELIEEENPLKVKGIIGSSYAVICSRFHGCVSALSQGVPCIGTSWSHKYERLFEEYSQEKCLIDPKMSRSDILDTFRLSINMTNDNKCIQARQKFKLSSEKMWDTVDSVIQ